MAGPSDNQIRKLARAMQGLAETVNSTNPHIKISQLVEACRLFDLEKIGFGPDFKFVYMEISSKVEYQAKKASLDETVQSVVAKDLTQGNIKHNSSPSRNLYRLKRIIEMALIVFEQVLANEGTNSLADAIAVAYDQVFEQYHGPLVKEAVSIAKAFIPSVSTFLNALKEDKTSVKEPFNDYIAAAKVVVHYIETIFQSNDSSAEVARLI